MFSNLTEVKIPEKKTIKAKEALGCNSEILHYLPHSISVSEESWALLTQTWPIHRHSLHLSEEFFFFFFSFFLSSFGGALNICYYYFFILFLKREILIEILLSFCRLLNDSGWFFWDPFSCQEFPEILLGSFKFLKIFSFSEVLITARDYLGFLDHCLPFPQILFSVSYFSNWFVTFLQCQRFLLEGSLDHF